MGCWWSLNGTVKPCNGKLDEVEVILSEYGCEFSSCLKEGTFDLSFSDERGYSFVDDLARELAPLLLDGWINVQNCDNDTYYIYSFNDGKYNCCVGENFTWFPGFEDEFVKALPSEVINAVLMKFAEKCDCNHDCDALYAAYRKGREDALKGGNRNDR